MADSDDLLEPPAAVVAYLDAQRRGSPPDRACTKAAVKAVLAELERRAPGRSVELRVPPYAAIQLIAGTAHRRGTPPALVQLAAPDLIDLAEDERHVAHGGSPGRTVRQGTV